MEAHYQVTKRLRPYGTIYRTPLEVVLISALKIAKSLNAYPVARLLHYRQPIFL